MNQLTKSHPLYVRIESFMRAIMPTLPASAVEVNERPHLLLGLSGGADSVFLFHFLRSLHQRHLIRLSVANLDHGWPSFSETEMLFCKRLCDYYHLPFFTKKISELELSVKYNGSQEEAGRRYRRYFLEELKKQHAARYIVLAHHADDQQETFFIRLLRGSSLQGLTGIKPNDGTYLRPLLTTPKKELVDYLTAHELPFFVDPTNNDDTRLRNRIRQHLCPELRRCDERFDQSFAATLERLNEENDFLQHLTGELFAPTFNETLHGSLKVFRQLHAVLQKRLLISWFVKNNVTFTPSNAHLDEVIRFLANPEGGDHVLGKNWKIIKKEGLFWIEKG